MSADLTDQRPKTSEYVPDDICPTACHLYWMAFVDFLQNINYMSICCLQVHVKWTPNNLHTRKQFVAAETLLHHNRDFIDFVIDDCAPGWRLRVHVYLTYLVLVPGYDSTLLHFQSFPFGAPRVKLQRYRWFAVATISDSESSQRTRALNANYTSRMRRYYVCLYFVTRPRLAMSQTCILRSV